MKRNMLWCLTLVMTVLLLAVGCGGSPTVKEFAVAASVKVEINTEYTVPAVTVTDSRGGTVAAQAKVTKKSDGSEVTLTQGKFVASDPQGYLITYSATVGEQLETRTTTVQVTDTTAPQIQPANPNASPLIVRGTTVRLKASDVVVSDNSGKKPEVTFSVVCGEQDVSLAEDGSFAVTKEGAYRIVYTATDDAGNSADYVRNVATTLRFGTEEELALFGSRGEIDFAVNRSADYTLLGETSAKATIAEGSSWPMIYWENLGDVTGTSSVSFYVYNDCATDQNIWLNMQETTAQGKRMLQAKCWNYIEIPAAYYASVFITRPADENYPSYGGTRNATVSVHFGSDLPAFSLYFTDLTVHKDPAEKLLISVGELASAKTGEAYPLPVPTIRNRDNEEVGDAQVTYAVYDDSYHAVAVANNAFVPQTEVSYLVVRAQKNGVVGFLKLKILAVSRAADEIEFFESETGIQNFTPSDSSTVRYETANTAGGSKGAMRFDPFVQYSSLTFKDGIGNADLTGALKIQFDVYIVDPTGMMQSGEAGYVAGSKVYFELGAGVNITESNVWKTVTIELPESYRSGTLVGKQLMIMSYKGSELADKNQWSEAPKLDAGFMFLFDNFRIVRA